MLAWVVLGTLLALGFTFYRQQRQGRPLPGPRGLPILGSALDLPPKLLFLKLDDWAKKYGQEGFFRFSAVGQKFVIVTNAEAASDLLEKMGGQTGARPAPPMAEYMLHHMMFSLEPYDERCRRCRRLAHESFNVRALADYRSLFEDETQKLLRRLVGVDPLDVGKKLVQFSGSLTYEAMYGVGTGGDDKEKKIAKVSELVQNLGDAMSPATFLVNLIPVLGILPESVSKWKQFGRRWYNDTNEFLLGMSEPGLKGESQAGFVASCIRMRDKTGGVSDEDIAWTSFAIYGAGMETTPFTLHWFILAMVLCPEVYKRARAEVDAAVGENGPTFEDRSRLPYLNAVIKETLRWRPVVPSGLPHMVSEDIEYKGCIIPRGSYIFGNQWNLCRDPGVYPEPDSFRPERYLNSPPAPDPPVFGFGRRICPGKEFALNALFLATASLLWAFDIKKALDESGNEITPSSIDFDGNLIVHPKPFQFSITPRRNIV